MKPLDAVHLCDLLEEALDVLDIDAAKLQSDLPSRIRSAVKDARAALEKQEDERAAPGRIRAAIDACARGRSIR